MLLSSFSSRPLTETSPVSVLLSHVRAHVAVSRLSSVSGGRFPLDAAGTLPPYSSLFRAVSRRCGASGLSLGERFRLSSVLYTLLSLRGGGRLPWRRMASHRVRGVWKERIGHMKRA